ncbi:MAG: hypothetical protein JKY15_05035 [Deltaproteobacteria bacterium]|nr:hypothetical protein [Deltaproteobacteria bacterium]
MFILILNALALGGFYLYLNHDSDLLSRRLRYVERAIEAKKSIQEAAQDFVVQKKALQDKVDQVDALAKDGKERLDKLIEYINQIPKSISLHGFAIEENNLKIMGRATSKRRLEEFLQGNRLKLLKLKRKTFEAVGAL